MVEKVRGKVWGRERAQGRRWLNSPGVEGKTSWRQGPLSQIAEYSQEVTRSLVLEIQLQQIL